MKRFISYRLFLLTLACSQSILAQEHHYWTNQFGSRSSLMSGAVVAGVRDTSAGYYNPAAIGYLDASTFSVSGNGYQVEMADVDNGAGTNVDVDSTKTNIIPLLISGTVKWGERAVGYSLIAKNTSSLSFSGRLENNNLAGLESNPGYIRGFDPETGNPIFGGTFDGDEIYRGQFLYDANVSEFWAGISMAEAVNNQWSFGATAFVAFREQSFNTTEFAKMTNPMSEFIASEDVFLYGDFYTLRTFLKMGMTTEVNGVKFGATITSPSLHIAGSGTVAGGAGAYREDAAIGVIADDRQEGLDAEYKTPLSIALGVEYPLSDSTNIAASIEWFDDQKRYEVVTPESKEFFVTGGNLVDSRDILTIHDEADNVLNVALAIEHKLTEKLTLYGGFRTDNSTYPGDGSGISYQKMGISNWDIKHLTFGFSHKREASELSMGLNYSFGSEDRFVQLATINPDDRQAGDFIIAFNSEDYAKANFRTIGLTIGYTYFFK